jgi:hypothetical protein
MVCELSADRLQGRRQEVPDMLLPITNSRRVGSSFDRQRDELLIGAHSGRKPDIGLRDWRFTTKIRRIRGSYWERWAPTTEKRRIYYLAQSYLQLYWRESAGDEESELVALHCDPNEADDTGVLRHAIYKRGPHIHVLTASQPLPHSHFALNLGNLPDILRSIDTLTGAVRFGINMIRDQVLDLFDAHGF